MHLFCLLLSSGLQQKYQDEVMHINNHPLHVEGFAIKDIAKGFYCYLFKLNLSVFKTFCGYNGMVILT